MLPRIFKTAERFNSEGVKIKTHTYVLIKIIGEGTFGIVYKAIQTGNSNKYYAIKILKQYTSKQLKEIEYEYKISQIVKCESPFVICAIEYGDTGSEYYIIMEYFDGIELRELITLTEEKHKHINGDDVLTIIKHIVNGVHYLHSKGVIHLDLKPANILFNENGMKLNIIDFGLACNIDKLIESELSCYTSKTKKLSGTKKYMSPEFFLMAYNKIAPSDEIYIKEDIWAIGVIINMLVYRDSQFIFYKKLKYTQVYEPISKIIADQLSLYGYTTKFSKDILNRITFPLSTYPQYPIIKKIADACLTIDYTKRPDTSELLKMLNHFDRCKEELDKLKNKYNIKESTDDLIKEFIDKNRDSLDDNNIIKTMLN